MVEENLTMKNLNIFKNIGNENLTIEGILNPIHHLGITDIIWWYKGESIRDVKRFTSLSLICGSPSNFILNKNGFRLGEK